MRQTSRFTFAAALLFLMAGVAPAQVPVVQRPAANANDAALLRRQIEDVFKRRVRLELGLTAQTAPGVFSIISAWGQRRIELERDEKAFRNQLSQQLRPGFAADPVVLERVIAALNDNRIAHAQTYRDEMTALTPVLTPVQRGLYQQLRDRLIAQILSAQLISPTPDSPPVRGGRGNGGY